MTASSRAGTATPTATSVHLGIDLGATNLKWAAVERVGDCWQSLGTGRIPTRGADGPDAVIERMIGLGRDALEGWPAIASVGIGVPGTYDPAAGRTRFLANLPGGWVDQPVGQRAGSALGIPVSLINDGRAFGLAELRLGAGRGVGSMIGLVLGTGVGGAIAVDGRVVLGHHGSAGEIGHQTLDPDGPECGCGNRGCLEALVRADRFAAACGADTTEAAVAAARAGDARAVAGLAEIGRWLGIGIANMIAVISPDRVVIGGGVAAAGDVLFEPIRAELARRVRTTELAAVDLVPAELGIFAGSIGAAIHGAEQAGLA